jgi:plastocyanin domain-containing protein
MKNKTGLIIIFAGLAIALGIFFIGSSKGNNNGNVSNTNKISTDSVQNSEIKDGVQYITIDAKGGYSPKVSTAKAGIPTKLIVRTNGTYDCSAALSIRSVGFQKVLNRTGEETIDLGTPVEGTPIRGVCGMGMYSFVINFE